MAQNHTRNTDMLTSEIEYKQDILFTTNTNPATKWEEAIQKHTCRGVLSSQLPSWHGLCSA